MQINRINTSMLCFNNFDKMYTSKSYMDCMNEMNRVFQEIGEMVENDILRQSLYRNSNAYQSPFDQSVLGQNRSSSSADSTSPESFPDTSLPFLNPSISEASNHGRPQIPCRTVETPYGPRRRPIVGRKIVTGPDYSQQYAFEPSVHISPIAKCSEQESELHNVACRSDDKVFSPQTPPNPTKGIVFEQKNYTRDLFYELFPSENKGFEFTTNKNVSPPSARFATSSANISPISSNISPPNSAILRRNLSPHSNSFPNPSPPSYNIQSRSPSNYPVSWPQREYQNPSNPIPVPNFACPSNFNFSRASNPEVRPSSSRFNQDEGKMCTFCRKNGETPMVYMTHRVKEKICNKYIVTCPILRSHVCTTCGASGDDAHTITYCPVLRSGNNGLPLQSTTITLKNTRIKSNGRRRF